MLRLNKKAFTLVEIMIVTMLMAALAAIAVPAFLRARVNAQETVACASIYTIYTAEVSYWVINPEFTTLAQLGSASPPYIDSALATGSKQGYIFVATPNTSTNFYVTAVHATGLAHSFYIDEDGVLCKSTAVGAAAVSAHHQGSGCPAGYIEME